MKIEIESSEQSNKLEILLHYESSFREDWRMLQKLRILVAGFYISLASALTGWVVKLKIEERLDDEKEFFIFLMVAVGVSAVVSMGWFGSSLNTLKRLIVQIEKALGLMDKNYYLTGETIIPPGKEKWGDHRIWAWGKSVILTIIISSLFIGVVYSI